MISSEHTRFFGAVLNLNRLHKLSRPSKFDEQFAVLTKDLIRGVDLSISVSFRGAHDVTPGTPTVLKKSILAATARKYNSGSYFHCAYVFSVGRVENRIGISLCLIFS